MKKLFVVLLLALIIIPLVSPADILYISKTGTGDSVITSVLNDLNYSYDLIDEFKIDKTNYSNYKMILIGDTAFNSVNIPKLAVITTKYPSLIFNSRYYFKMGTNYQWGWGTLQSSTSGIQLTNTNVSSPISDGINTNFNAYTSDALSDPNANIYLVKGMRPINITIVSYPKLSTSSEGAVAFVPVGTKMLNGNITKGRSLFFGITATKYWTGNTTQMFKNSVNWVIKGQDRDEDGFFNEVDCNDDDPTINPNATEIPYDYIDQSCKGADLADVDIDGYCAAGYSIGNKNLQCPLETVAIGTDCNDNNPEFHPNATDLTKNCINNPPIMIRPIENQTWLQGERISLNLSEYFTDIEGENLTYNISKTSNDGNISVSIIDGIVNFISSYNWFGKDWIIFGVSDGTNTVKTNNISLEVIHVNQPPVINPLQPVYVVAGHTASISPSAEDIDGDNVTFSFSSPFNSSGKWTTTGGDEGDYEIVVTANDGNSGIDSVVVPVSVISKLYINEFSFDKTGWVELYNPGNKEINLGGCSINNNQESVNLTGSILSNGFYVANFNNSLNQMGDNIQFICDGKIIDQVSFGDLEGAPIPINNQSTGRSSDGYDGGVNSFRLFSIATEGLINSADMTAPVVNLISSVEGTVINVHSVTVSFNASDNSAELTCDIYLNINGDYGIANEIPLTLVNATANGTISINSIDDGNYKLKVGCSDERNTGFSSEQTFTINAPDTPRLNNIDDKTVLQNQTVRFSVNATDPDSGDNLTYSVQSLPFGAVFSGNTFSWIPNFNQTGNFIVKVITTDGLGLSDYQNVNIFVNKVILPPSFRDIKKCANVNGDILVTINQPKNNDKVNIGDTLYIEAKLKNNLNKTDKFYFTSYLYDTTDEGIIDSRNIKQSVIKSETVTEEFNIPIPATINPDHGFAVYTYAESDDMCNFQYNLIDVQRASDKVIISKVYIDPSIANYGEEVNVRVKVQNVGDNDEEVIYVELINNELGVDQKSDSFTLERYGDQDSVSKYFTFTVPKDIEAQTYELTANVYFNDESFSYAKNLTVAEDNRNVIISDISENASNTITYQNDQAAIDSNTVTYSLDSSTYAVSDNTATTTRTIEPNTIFGDNNLQVSNTKSSFFNFDYKKSLKYLNEPAIRYLLLILDIVFILGIIIFITRVALVYMRK